MRTVILLCATLGVAGCGVDKDLYEAKVAELNKTKAELDQQRADAEKFKKAAEERQAQLDKENADLKDKLTALGQDYNASKVDAEKAKKTIDDLRKQQEQAAKRAEQFRQMVAKFKSMIDAGKLQVEFRNGLMLVKLPDNILFDPGKVDIKPAGQEAINQVTQILSGIEGRKFQVTGHTDNVAIKSGRWKSNWELSTARALEVVKLMIKDGMDEKRLSAAGYADTLPVGDNASDEGRRMNRRIEIVVVPNIEELPGLEEATKPQG